MQTTRAARLRLGRCVVEGFALDEKRLRGDPVALQSLTDRVRALRAEDQNLHAEVRECFMVAASDHNEDAEGARTFFRAPQERFTCAASERTSAESILARADHRRS